ncbi:WYL domain-containing protein [Oerskovia sp. M15]
MWIDRGAGPAGDGGSAGPAVTPDHATPDDATPTDATPDHATPTVGTSGGPVPRAHAYLRVLRSVEQSLTRSLVLAIRYRDARGSATARRVEPVILAHMDATWYLVAWCRTRVGIRWFRLDRIERADLTGETYVPRPVAEVGTPPSGAAPVA